MQQADHAGDRGTPRKAFGYPNAMLATENVLGGIQQKCQRLLVPSSASLIFASPSSVVQIR